MRIIYVVEQRAIHDSLVTSHSSRSIPQAMTLSVLTLVFVVVAAVVCVVFVWWERGAR